MRKKIILSFVCAIAFLMQAHAQEWSFGAHAGVDVSNFVGGNGFKVYDEASKVGYEVGGDARYVLKNGVNFSAGLSLVQTGGKFSAFNNSHKPGLAPINVRMLSLELPVKVGCDFKVARGFSVIPFVGAYGRYALASLKDNVTIAPLGETYKWNCYEDFKRYYYQIDAFRRFEIGVTAGVDLQVCKHYNVSFCYKRGLTELSRQYGFKSQTFSFSIGYRW